MTVGIINELQEKCSIIFFVIYGLYTMLFLPTNFIIPKHGCPCGYFGSDSRRGKCSPSQIAPYLSRSPGFWWTGLIFISMYPR